MNINELRIVTLADREAWVLGQRAAEVDIDVVGLDVLEALSDRMVSLMEASGGVGLAAPQVGLSMRMFVARIGGIVRTFVNPTLELDGDVEVMEEGCLSVPGVVARIRRPTNAVGWQELIPWEILSMCPQRAWTLGSCSMNSIITIVNRMNAVARISCRRALRRLGVKI